ncbi:MAG: hypothetical protein V4467_04685 [Patescibacteria group bacterium]
MSDNLKIVLFFAAFPLLYVLILWTRRDSRKQLSNLKAQCEGGSQHEGAQSAELRDEFLFRLREHVKLFPEDVESRDFEISGDTCTLLIRIRVPQSFGSLGKISTPTAA